MISIKINNMEGHWDDVKPNWLHREINNRLDSGVSVSVQVKVQKEKINVALIAGGSPRAMFGSKPLNESEQKVLDVWHALGVDTTPLDSTRLVDFLNQVDELVC